MPETYDRTRIARELLLTQRHGVLATLSLDVPGYPFGSITPYTVDHAGEPLILISTIAQHTKNIQADSRVSLTVHDASNPDPQAAARLTWIADAQPVAADDVAAYARYRAYFPQSADYMDTHDFLLYRLRPVRARFIGGFGRIFWLERDELLQANPFAEAEADIVEHMNEDHAHNLAAYCRAFKGLEATEVRMLGIDADGFDVSADGRPVRFAFDAPIATPDEARMAMVKLARAARETLGV
jgi:putative heme iron utilization protein